MSESSVKAAVQLAQADVYQLRLSGLILSVLVDRGLLDQSQVRGLLDDVLSKMPDDLPIRTVYDELKKEFPG